ncbi:MAG TPA: capsule assembly Wzi family protein [Gemmatimonadaceae bacterium]|nr:capsule assembly Wzi family protein [Gemmatimonadaceae bacterium]
MPRGRRLGRRWIAAGALSILGSLAARPRALVAQSLDRPLHPLVALPLQDPAYEQLAGLERLGCRAARVSPYRPFTVAAIRRALDDASSEPSCASPLLDDLRSRFTPPPPPPLDTTLVAPDLRAAAIRPDTGTGLRLGAAATVRATGLSKGDFRPRWRDVQPTDEGDPPVAAILRGRATWDGGSRLVAVVEAYGQTHRRNDPLVRVEQLRSTSGVVDFSEAYLAGRIGPLVASFGRSREAWMGEGTESLLLSAHGPPLDRLQLALSTRHFEARALYAGINDVVLTNDLDAIGADQEPQRFYRYLAGHALTWAPVRAVELTIGETALLARGSRVPDVSFANPLMVYLVTQHDESRTGAQLRDNLMAFGSVRLQSGRAMVTGDLLIDDLQLDAGDRALTPNQLGWSIRAAGGLPTTLPLAARAEYRRTSTFTYLRTSYEQVYQQYDAPLGSEIGPDADLIRGSLELWLGGRARVDVGAGTWRRGARRIDRRPAEGALQQGQTPFPSTTEARPAVQEAIQLEAGFQLLNVRLPVSFRVEAARIENVNNAASAAALYMRTQLIATYAFRYP